MNFPSMITIGIFIILQIGSGLIILTKLQGGQTALKEHLDSLASSVSKLSDAIASINVSDARYEERAVQISASVTEIRHRLDHLERDTQDNRRKYHKMSGFLQGMVPEWKEIEKQDD